MVTITKITLPAFRQRQTPSILPFLFCLLLIINAALPSWSFADQASSITQFGITWTFDANYTMGQFANGDYWVVGPVKIIGLNPPSFTTNDTYVQGSDTFPAGVTINGSMLNPVPGGTNGYVSTLSGYSASLNVALGVNAANPLTVPAGSSLVSTISRTDPGNGNRSMISTAAILTVLESAPPKNSFRPSYCGASKTVRYNISDVNAQLPLLGTLAPVASTPVLETVESYFERPWLDHKNGWSGRAMHPALNMPDYGAELSTRIGVGALTLQLNYSNTQKQKLLIRFIQLGIDNYGIIEAGNINLWPPDGGHASGRKWPILFAGIMLNDANMKAIGAKSGDYLYTGGHGPGNPPPDYIYFGEDGQTFYVTQDDINLHHDLDAKAGTVIPGYSYPYNTDYNQAQLNLPEFGIRHATQPRRDDVNWNSAYRQNPTGAAWAGFILAAHIMESTAGAKALWNHNALFEYQDRFMAIQLAVYGAHDIRRSWSNFTADCWDSYRANYGKVWTIPTPVPDNNGPPNADAGPDQALTDLDGSGSEQVTLDGSHSSSPNGSIVSYVWTEKGVQIATGINPTITLPIGQHTITLRVTDNNGLTDTDTVVITVEELTGNITPPVEYTLTTRTSGSGTVTRNPNQATYHNGDTVTIQAAPNTGYVFGNWSGDTSGTNNPAVIVINSNKSVTANFVKLVVVVPDTTPPSVTSVSPVVNTIQAPLNSLITLHIADAGSGVDGNSVLIKVNNNTVYSGNTADYINASGSCHRIGTKTDYVFVYQPSRVFNFDQAVNVTVNAADLAGNSMHEYSYSFSTEMYSFGKNKKINSGSDTLDKGAPVTVADSNGNIWVAWDAGPAGSRDIYVGKLAAGTEDFGASIKLTDNIADHHNPAIAVNNDNKLYVAWQENRNGKWDIYMSASADGATWSAERKVADSDSNHANAAIIVDNAYPKSIYIAWQDDLAGNQDIYIAKSSNDFATKTVSRITSGNSDQTDPALAVDSNNTVYVVWADSRNGSVDIYGASSNNNLWTNVSIVNKPANQSNPKIAAGAGGNALHFVWVDEIAGNKDIYYATSQGLPASPLTGRNIVDDTSNADQIEPVIVTSGTGADLKVYACWQDKRNVASSSKDTDLYMTEINSSSGANVCVGDDATNSNQSHPAIGVDEYGYIYLVWIDDWNTTKDVYYAGSTVATSNVIASEYVPASSGATVGIEPTAIESTNDVSVSIPLGAYLCDVNIAISKVKNPPMLSVEYLSMPYEFGPSGITFNKPVTITIPYEVSDSNYVASVYWYNTLTSSQSQQGISNVEIIKISPTLCALRFNTTHFTQFFVGGNSPDTGGSSGGGGGGGGCSMSGTGQGNIMDFMLPYIGLAIVMMILKLRDARRRKASSI